MKCAIIGNGSNLLNSSYGNFIDDHDVCIRCNFGIIEGYEKFVGTKTNIRFCNSVCIKLLCGLNNEDIFISKFDINHIYNTYNENIYTDAFSFLMLPHRLLKDNRIKQIPIDSVKKARNLMMGKKPTIGFLAIQYAIDLQIFDSINLFGFSFFKELKDQQSCHYYEITKNIQHLKFLLNSAYNPSLENNIIKTLDNVIVYN